MQRINFSTSGYTLGQDRTYQSVTGSIEATFQICTVSSFESVELHFQECDNGPEPHHLGACDPL